MVHNVDGLGRFLHRKKFVTPGYSLAMIVYVIGIPPLTRGLQAAHLQVTQPWYINITEDRE